MTKPIKFLFICIICAMSMPALAQKPEGPPSATAVVVSIVKREAFNDQVEALGTLKANESVDLTSTVTEGITAIHFEDGQRVKQGDLLIEMDANEEQAELTEQQSFLEEAQKQVKRLEPLVKKGAASESTLDEWRREKLTAEARIKAIRSRIDQRILRAPYDGVLGLRNVSVGALAQPGTLITTIDDDLKMKLDFAVPEVFLKTLKPGIVIKATTEAFPGETFNGTVSSVDSRIDPVTRSIKARALIDNKDGRLKPGLLMQVTLQKNPREALVVPEEALIANGPDNFVMVVQEEDGNMTAARKKVELGTRQFGKAEILNGLEAGDKVITHGTLKVRPGSQIEIAGIEDEDKRIEEILEPETAQ